MFRKRAQAAMEFLMTYGWAILVVLVAIGALAYFGVLSPDKFLPERCTGPAGFDCVDKASIHTGGGVTFAVKNNQGFTINLTAGGSASDDCNPTGNFIAANVTTLAPNIEFTVKNNDQVIINASCGTLEEGRFKSDITIPYENLETGIMHKATVSITGISTN